MSYLQYKSINDEGVVTSAVGEFEDEIVLMDMLSAKGEQLIECKEYPVIYLKLREYFNGKLSAAEVVEVCNFLSMYIGGGLDINAALCDMAKSAKRPLVKEVVEEIRKSLLDGYPLSESIKMTNKMPDLVFKMAALGEESGKIESMLKDAADHIDRVEKIKSATKRALIYPGFTLVAMFGGFVFWMAYVVPKLVGLFITMGVELPTATKFLIAMSDFVANYWGMMILISIIIPIVYKLSLNSVRVKFYVHKWMWNAPIFGEMIQMSQMAFYFQYLSLMYESGVVMSTALTGVRDAVNNSFFKSRLERIELTLRDGYALSESFSKPELFDSLALRMVGIGEQTGKLDTQLRRLSDTYFTQLQSKIEVIGKIIEPLIMAVVGLFFAFFAVALLGPLYDLIAGVG